MSFQLPPVIKIAERLLVDIERASAGFSRRFKYGYGADLRAAALEATLTAQRAWRQPARRAEHLALLVEQIDEVKLRLQVGSRLQAFASFGQFETLARTAADLGRQVGGWVKQHPKVQNSSPRKAPERDQILSTRSASRYEANR